MISDILNQQSGHLQGGTKRLPGTPVDPTPIDPLTLPPNFKKTNPNGTLNQVDQTGNPFLQSAPNASQVTGGIGGADGAPQGLGGLYGRLLQASNPLSLGSAMGNPFAQLMSQYSSQSGGGR